MQFLVFPAYLELKDRSNSRFSTASTGSISIETIFYIFIGFFGLILLGPDPIKADFLKNMSDRPGVISFIIRLLFCLLIMLDMPFMYMATKEQGLVIHDEIVNNSISKRTELIMEAKAVKKDDKEEKSLENEEAKIEVTEGRIRRSSTLPFWKLSDSVFFYHTLALHLVCMSLAIASSQIGWIFDLIGALTTSFSIFLFPAIGFLTAYNRVGSNWQESDSTKRLYLVFAWIFVPLGVMLFISALTLNALRLTGHISSDTSNN